MAVKVLISLMVLYLSIIPAQGVSKHGKVVVCYCNPIEVYYYEVHFIDHLSLCTHLVVETGYIVNKNNAITIDPIDTSSFIKYINSTKLHYMLSTKVIMAIKIGYEKNVFNIPSNQQTRDQLIQNAINLTDEYKLDGFDLYLSDLPQTPEEAENLVLFAQDLKETFIFSSKFIILTATFVGRNKLVSFTNKLVNLSSYLDHIHIPTSNLITTSRRLQHTFAPLKARAESDVSSVEFAIKHLLANGVKPTKLVLSMDLNPFFYLSTDSETKDIRLEDLVAIDNLNSKDLYFSICAKQYADERKEEWHYHWSEANSARYFKRDSVIIFSENPRSVVAKVKMGVDYGLKGFALRFQRPSPCQSPNDTYTEFIERYNKLKEDPFLLQKLKDLNLPNVDADGKLDGRSYGILNNTLYFQAPQTEYQINFFKTINEAVAVSLEEREILDAVKTNDKKQKPYCLFWPVCAAPIPLTTPATDASDAT